MANSEIDYTRIAQAAIALSPNISPLVLGVFIERWTTRPFEVRVDELSVNGAMAMAKVQKAMLDRARIRQDGLVWICEAGSEHVEILGRGDSLSAAWCAASSGRLGSGS